MPNTINYVTQFDNKLRELYGQELTSDALYNSNTDIQIIGAKNIKIPTLTVSGYKDHNRSSMSFNTGSYENNFEEKTLDHDRDIEFGVDPMDVDETNTILSVANIHNRFERTQAIPELDCYTYSKIYTEAKRVGASIKNTAFTSANVLSDFDDNIEAFEDVQKYVLKLESTLKKIKVLFLYLNSGRREKQMSNNSVGVISLDLIIKEKLGEQLEKIKSSVRSPAEKVGEQINNVTFHLL